MKKQNILRGIYLQLTEWMSEIPVRKRHNSSEYAALWEERNDIAILYIQGK